MKYTSCRICGSKNLIQFLDLGMSPLADNFIKRPDYDIKKYPLGLVVCADCHLVANTETLPTEVLFPEDYTFYSSASPSLLRYFEQYADLVKTRYPRQSKGFVVEIASNDGILLKHFNKSECVLGIDPAVGPAKEAKKVGVTTLTEPFTSNVANKVLADSGKADLIMANNVVAHVDDLMDFLGGVANLLDDDGVFIMEVQYFVELLFRNQFDHVYHEHRSFFSLTPLMTAFKNLGLEVQDVIITEGQGGSLRLFIRHAGRSEMSQGVVDTLGFEEALGINTMATYMGFDSRVRYLRYSLGTTILGLIKQGKTVAGYGASAKSTTLLNYCQLDNIIIPYIVDKTPVKYNRYTPGTNIKIIDQDKAKTPDVYLLLVWNYLPQILQRESKFIQKGGKFLVPIPNVMLI